MYEYSQYGASLSVKVDDRFVKFWIESHGEVASFEFDLEDDQDLQEFKDLILKLNNINKARKD